MRRSAAFILSLIVPSAAIGAQAAPAYTASPPPAPPAMPADDVASADPELRALRDTVTRQNAVIANQKALIAALNARLASLKRKCP